MVRELRDRARLDVRGVNLRLAERMLGVLNAIRREGDRLAVGREARAAVVPVTVGDLARRAAVGPDHENMPHSFVGVTDAVGAEIELRNNFRRLDPFGAL